MEACPLAPMRRKARASAKLVGALLTRSAVPAEMLRQRHVPPLGGTGVPFMKPGVKTCIQAVCWLDSDKLIFIQAWARFSVESWRQTHFGMRVLTLTSATHVICIRNPAIESFLFIVLLYEMWSLRCSFDVQPASRFPESLAWRVAAMLAALHCAVCSMPFSDIEDCIQLFEADRIPSPLFAR
eukprot:6173348-Pleurochrysis_carterae.AAC.2